MPTNLRKIVQKTFDGKKYQIYKNYSTKSEADKTARACRKLGIPARVIHYDGLKGGPWLVYIRPDKNWNLTFLRSVI